jgi:hypothetical protein
MAISSDASRQWVQTLRLDARRHDDDDDDDDDDGDGADGGAADADGRDGPAHGADGSLDRGPARTTADSAAGSREL